MILFIETALGLGLNVIGGFLNGGEEGGPPQWDRVLDPYGRSQKMFRQWAGLPVGGQGGFRNLTEAQKQIFLSGEWGDPAGRGSATTLATYAPRLPSPTGSGAGGGGVIDRITRVANYLQYTPGTVGQYARIVTGAQRMAAGGMGALPMPARGGGEVVGTRGTDFTPGPNAYPAGPNLEDLMEQTFTPDLWARRITRGIARLAAPIKRGYSVPLVDWEGDIEGRIRATHGPIKKSAVILYGGASDETMRPELLGPMLKGLKFVRHCEVVDEEGGGSDPVTGFVFEPPKRRRTGIHISGPALRTARKVARDMKRHVKVQRELKALMPRR